MALYALTIFLSAFLLFQVQPLVGRFILPWFGGTPAVWNTCMLFFQILLLGGYTYAHVLVSKMTRKQQGLVHLCMLALALVALATVFPPDASWKPRPDDNPIVRIMLLLGFCIGVPYLMISSTGPLLQDWFAHSHPGVSPYRLYSLSNIGSLLALITYPFLFEPYLELQTQARLWAAGYAIFAAVCGVCAWKLLKEDETPAKENPFAAKLAQAKKAAQTAAGVEPVAEGRPSVMDMALWLALPACGSAALLATTNQLCQDVAVVPFLWVLPLSLYLLSFIICFDNQEWYARSWFVVALALAVFAGTVVLKAGVSLKDFSFHLEESSLFSWMEAWGETRPFSWFVNGENFEIDSLVMQVVVYCFVLFSCCMCCHGELVHMKPSSKYLTLFYLMVSLGGALGGMFVAVGAPLLFNGFWEYPVCLLACCGLMAAVIFRDFLNGWKTGLGMLELGALTSLVCLTALLALAPGGLKLLEGELAKKSVMMFEEGTKTYEYFFTDAGRLMQLAFWIVPQLVACGWTWLAMYRDGKNYTFMNVAITLGSLIFALGLAQVMVAMLASTINGAAPLVPRFFAWGWNNEEEVMAQVFRGTLFMGLAGLGVWVAIEYQRMNLAAVTAGFLAAVAIVGFGKLSYELADFVVETDASAIAMTRNFYGVLRILDNDPENPDADWHKYTLMHGRITHGFQYTNPKKQDMHTSYYGPESAIGIACEYHPQRLKRQQVRIGVIGLGTGTMATYAERGDYIRFYDINQAVVDMCDQYFTYRQNATKRGADVDVFMGDARIVMERQIDNGEAQKFDILVVDAFSSDAIPVHLLTEECCKIYWKHLKEDGILAVHISNRYLDLKPVVRSLAKNDGKEAVWVDNDGDDSIGVDGSSWILVTSNKEFLATPELRNVVAKWDKNGTPRELIRWTDDFSSIWPILQLE